MPATVQLINGDTLNGWIDETGLKNVPNRIRYQQNPDASESTFYYAHLISGFRVINGSNYRSYVGDVDSSHVIVLHKKSPPKPAQVTDTLFLQMLAEGRVSLLYGSDKRGIPHYFLMKENSIPEELHYFQFISYSEGTTRACTRKHRLTVPIKKYTNSKCLLPLQIINLYMKSWQKRMSAMPGGIFSSGLTNTTRRNLK